MKKLLFVPPLLVGAAVFGWFVSKQEPPVQRPPAEVRRVLRVIRVPEVDVVPVVIGHGTVEPEKVWRAVAEVKGRVQRVHPRLAPGELIKEGEELLRIDPSEYALVIAQLEADIDQANAQLSELEAQSANYVASLAIEKKSLDLAGKELARLSTLQQRNAASASELDTQERTYLSQQKNVQNLENSINLIPAERKSLNATLAVKETNLQQAKIDLAKTKMVAPFDCRLGDLSLEIDQFLGAGEVLFEALSTAATEIEFQVAPHDVRRLIDPGKSAFWVGSVTPEQLRDELAIGATVRLRSGNSVAEWEGRPTRLREELDTQTRTLGIVVVVDKPYEKIVPGRRPALVRGMYCEVELRGKQRSQSTVIPRSALHQGHVYLLDANNRLRRQPVEVDFQQADWVCLSSGLNKGERLVVSDPAPAVEGMLVDPVEDAVLLSRLVRSASMGSSSE